MYGLLFSCWSYIRAIFHDIFKILLVKNKLYLKISIPNALVYSPMSVILMSFGKLGYTSFLQFDYICRV